MRFSACLLLLGVLSVGCGNSIGGPCTVSRDCPNQLCINDQAYTPGGYCTKQCVVGQDATCPSSATCVDKADGTVAGCFKTCTKTTDCRDGYVCMTGFHGNQNSLCVGPTS